LRLSALSSGHKSVTSLFPSIQFIASFQNVQYGWNPHLTRLLCWCREGESIPAIFKGIAKISPILANCNIGAGLRVVLRRDSKSAWGQFPVIWGDFGIALKSLDAMKQLGIQTHLRSKNVDESTIAEPCLPR